MGSHHALPFGIGAVPHDKFIAPLARGTPFGVAFSACRRAT